MEVHGTSQNNCKAAELFLRQTGSDGDDRVDPVDKETPYKPWSLFAVDCSSAPYIRGRAAGKARSPMVAHRVRGATSTDVGYLKSAFADILDMTIYFKCGLNKYTNEFTTV